MISAMSIVAFADDEDYYSIAGDARLFGTNDDKSADFWNTEREDLLLNDNGDGTFSQTFTSAAAGDFQFKIIKAGADFGWSYQCCIGNPATAWADNQTQFQATMAAGEYTVYVQPSKGFVTIIQNKAAVPLTGRYHSRDEDSSNFVALNKAAIEADGYKDVPDFDAEYKAFIDKCVTAVGGTAATPDETTTAAIDETTTAAETTTAIAETTTKKDEATTKAVATTTEKSDDSDDGISPVVIVVIVVAVVAVIGVVVVIAKKKKSNQ